MYTYRPIFSKANSLFSPGLKPDLVSKLKSRTEVSPLLRIWTVVPIKMSTCTPDEHSTHQERVVLGIFHNLQKEKVTWTLFQQYE